MLVSGCLIALSACSGSTAGRSDEPSARRVNTVRSPVDIRLPLDAYIERPEMVQAVVEATNLLGRECMRRLGLDWRVDAPRMALHGPARSLHARRYGLLERSEAARGGYHSPLGEAGRSSADSARRKQAPSKTELDAWTGEVGQIEPGRRVPEGGCVGAAMRNLERGAPKVPDVRPPQLLANDALHRAERDGRVRAAFDSWSACMRRAGFDYDSPWDANDDPRWRTRRPTSLEISTALVDVRCRAETHLVDVWYAVEKQYQTRVVHRLADQLALVRSASQVRLRNASHVLAAGRAG